MKKTLTLFAFATLLCLMPQKTWAQTENIVNVVEQTASVTRTSTLYVGEVLLDGQQSFCYLYSEDISFSPTVLAAVQYCLSNFKDGAYSALVPSTVGFNGQYGIAVCSNSAYESMMSSEWKSADKAGLACLPNTTVVSSSSENLYETNDDFAEICSTFLSDDGVTLVGQAGETLTPTGIIGALSGTSTDNVTYTVIDGELVELVDRYINYSCELTTVIYTKVELTSGSTSSVLGDVDGDGTVSVTDVAWIVNHILGVSDDNFIIANADINGDGEIDVNDVMATVSIILEGDNTPQAYLTCPDEHHPHMIDLGLPSGTLWTCCNVDATTPEGNGGYYAWGETEEKSYYEWDSYIYCDGSYGTCHDIGSDIAGTKYDVAHVKWGGSWVMPSKEQFEELRGNCTFEWTTENGVNGGKITSSNGGTIFLPATGYFWGDDITNGGSRGCYWLSTLNPSNLANAYHMGFYSGGVYLDVQYGRRCGRCVRPVFNK